MAISLNYKGSNNQKGAIPLTDKPIIIGRSSTCDVKITDDLVSGKHLAVKIGSSGKVVIKDLGTTNGTTVNGSAISECVLMIDDVIQIGQIIITIDVAQLTAKEKELHTKEGKKTQIRYINLGNQTEPNSKKPAEQTKAQSPQKQNPTTAEKPKPVATALNKNTVAEFNPNQDINLDDINLDNIDMSELSEKEQTILQEKIKKRIMEKSRHVENMRRKLLDEKITQNVKSIDLEPPTGETEFMKVDKKKTPRPKTREELRDKTVVTTFADKLLGLFKKKKD